MVSCSTPAATVRRQKLTRALKMMGSGWILAALIGLTIRDLSGITLLNVLYYATPGPVMYLSGWLLGCGFAAVHDFRRAAVWCLLATSWIHCAGSSPVSALPIASPSLQVAGVDQQPVVAPEHKDVLDRHVTGESWRLLYWNCCHLNAGLDNVAAEMVSWDADIIALVEAGAANEIARSQWKQFFPEYDVTFLGAELIVLTRGVVQDVRAIELAHASRSREVDLVIDGQLLTLMIVDICGNPTLPRGRQLEQLAERAEQFQDRCVLVAGDFNTPRESLLFQPLEQQLTNAYDVVGQGYGPTWPAPLPVLTLDQIWGNSRLTFANYRAGWSSHSDHRPIAVEFSCLR